MSGQTGQTQRIQQQKLQSLAARAGWWCAFIIVSCMEATGQRNVLTLLRLRRNAKSSLLRKKKCNYSSSSSSSFDLAMISCWTLAGMTS